MRDAPIVRRVLLLAAALVIVSACAEDPRVARLATDIGETYGLFTVSGYVDGVFHGESIVLSDGFRGIGSPPPGYSRTAAQRQAFLCEKVAPMVHAAGLDGIDVSWESGPERLSDCP